MGKLGGGARVIIEKDKFEELCKIQCTELEICAVMGCNTDTINKFCKNTYKDENGKPMTFRQASKMLREGGKCSLRRSLWKAAVEDRNPTILIWKAKQHLGESDNPGASEEKQATINFNINKRSVRVEQEQNKTNIDIDDEDWEEDWDDDGWDE